jgi:AcrR family transcriptional regulator
LEAGVEIVSEQGDATHATIRAVTKRAGVSPTAFYLHFPTRDAFLAALKQRGFEEFRAAIDDAAATGGEDPAARLHAASLGYIRFARERPDVYAMIFSPAAHGDTDLQGPGRESFQDLMDRIEAYLEHQGGDAADIKALALALWTGLHGFVTLSYAARQIGWPTDEQFAASLIEAWLQPRGAATRGS